MTTRLLCPDWPSEEDPRLQGIDSLLHCRTRRLLMATAKKAGGKRRTTGKKTARRTTNK